MLDFKFIRENTDQVEENCRAKGARFDREEFARLDRDRRDLLRETEGLQARRNQLAKETGRAKGRGEDISALKKDAADVSARLKERADQLREAEERFQSFCLDIPNLIHPSVPVGKDEAGNRTVRAWGEKPDFDFTPRPHWELSGQNGSFDFERAARMSGSRFAVYLGSFARLERVLIQFMLDFHTRRNGYTEVLPPFLVNARSMTGTGNLPKFREDLYKIEDQDLYLVPTAEVPLTNLHAGEQLDPDSLPLNYVAHTPCFRSEAGSYGKDIRGIIRQHQFNKVELLKFTLPENSDTELEQLTANAEAVLQALGLHYRVRLLCSGDMSFTSAKTYDLEVWMPARQDYLEISSCSNFSDFQARRAGIRYRSRDKKRKGFVHTLNGSGLAVGRTVAAILENGQRKNGEIVIPAVLRGFFSGEEIL